MGNEERPGIVRLLTAEDLATDLVGWKPSKMGVGSLIMPKGWAMLRIVVRKPVNGEMQDFYDQPILVENAGAIVVCQSGDRVGFIRSYRFVAERILPNAGKDYIRELEEQERWPELLAACGKWQWELPRGLAQLDEKTDLEKFVLASAKAEALEEAGYTVTDARICGRLNTNPTFFPHSQYVVHARIASIGAQQLEDAEIIGETRLFSAPEIRGMANRGELEDGISLAALALAGFHF